MMKISDIIKGRIEKTPGCNYPFQHLWISSEESGYIARTCCTSWLSPKGKAEIKVHIDPRDTYSIRKAWESPAFRKIRESTIHGDFQYCNSSCPFKVRKDSLVVDLNNTPPPVWVTHAIDFSCNLRCPSCRNSFNNTFNPDSVPVLKALLKLGSPNLFLSGSGEFFINTPLLSYFSSFSKEDAPLLTNIEIITNGNAFTLQKWYELSPYTRSLVKIVMVSVDSSSPEVYKRIRRGGDYRKVESTFRDLRILKKAGEISGIRASMVVQKGNYLEIEEFAHKMIELGASMIMYQRIQNWGQGNSEFLNYQQDEEARLSIDRVKATYSQGQGITIESGL